MFLSRKFVHLYFYFALGLGNRADWYRGSVDGGCGSSRLVSVFDGVLLEGSARISETVYSVAKIIIIIHSGQNKIEIS